MSLLCRYLICHNVFLNITKVNKNSKSTPLRMLGLIVLIIGAIGSFYLTLEKGQHNRSAFLDILFLIWVLSPFAALYIASILSERWGRLTRKSLYLLMLVVTPFSLVCYGGNFHLHGTKPAFIFLVTPPILWLLIAIVIPIAELVVRRKVRGSEGR